MSELKKILRNRLKVRKNPQYLKWLSEKYKGQQLDRHHIISSVYGLKLNDLLIAMISHEEHMKGHYKANTEDFEANLLDALENLFNYVEFLQEKH